jgi:hypothetical protein
MSQQPDEQPSSGPDDTPDQQVPPKKNNRVFFLVGGGLVVVAIALVVVLVVTRGPDTSSPEDVAEGTVSAFNEQDVDELVDLTCAEDKQEVGRTLTTMTGYGPDGEGFEVNAELRGVTADGADAAVAELEITYVDVPEDLESGFTEGSSVHRKLALRQEDGEWCVSWFD